MQITSETRAANIASNFINQRNNLDAMYAKAKAAGFPAQGNQPTVTGEQIETALGTANVALFDASLAANPQS